MSGGSRAHMHDALRSIRGGNLKGLSVLDLGCGYSCSDLRIARRDGASLCVGLDLGEKPVRDVLRDEVNYVRGDICMGNLPFKDSSFDIAVMDAVIEHLQDPAAALSGVYRVLRPGGNFILVTPNHASLKNRVKLMLGGSVYAPLTQWTTTARFQKGGRTEFVGHVREYIIQEIEIMLRNAGFKIISRQMYNVGMMADHSVSDATFGAGPDLFVESDSIERLSKSRFLLNIYGVVETLVPSWRYTIAVTAKKE